MPIFKRREEKRETPEKETKGIAYSIAMREMADDTSSLKKLNRGEEQKKERCGRIAKEEGLEMDDKAIEALIYVGDGDMRKLTNVLQSAAMFSKKITESEVYNVASRARPTEIISMLKYSVEGNFEKAREELDTLMLKHGLGAEDILTQCYREIQSMNIDERAKLKTISYIGECNFRVVEGANERIQLEAFLANLSLIAKGQ